MFQKYLFLDKMSFILLSLTILCYIIHRQFMTKVIAQENKFTHLSGVTNICTFVLLFIYHHVIQIVVRDQWLRLASHFDFCGYDQIHISTNPRRPPMAIRSRYLMRPTQSRYPMRPADPYTVILCLFILCLPQHLLLKSVCDIYGVNVDVIQPIIFPNEHTL